MIADPQQSDRAQQLVGYLDVFRGESQAPMGFADDLLFSLILLRWLDHTDAELEAMATFEDRPYRRVLAHELQWRQLYKDQDPATRAARYKAVLRLAEDRTADESSPLAVYLQAAARTLARSLSVTLTYIEDLFRWVDAAPFETTADRRQLLELVDSTVDKMSTSQVELSWSPKSVTRLVVALARPRAGEKVYDPCFGSGEFLAALWQRTERDPSAARRPGALLEIAGIERNESAFLRGLVRQLLTGVHLPRLQLGDALERDAAACAIRDGFDIVVAEPPWGDRVGARASRDARSYQHYQFQTTDTVGLFVQHAVEQHRSRGKPEQAHQHDPLAAPLIAGAPPQRTHQEVR